MKNNNDEIKSVVKKMNRIEQFFCEVVCGKYDDNYQKCEHKSECLEAFAILAKNMRD